MPRTISAAALPAALSARAHRINARVESALDSIGWNTRMARLHPAEGDHFAANRALAARSVALHEAALGDLLLAEDPAEGDRLIVGASLYELRPTGKETMILVAGEWEKVAGFKAVHVGDAPLPGWDDEATDETAEWAADYRRAVAPC